jgi:hypothetical protein
LGEGGGRCGGFGYAGRGHEVVTPLPWPFRLVYRAFERVEFDPGKSGKVFEARGFDLGFSSRIFPGYVLEREDTRSGYGERRFKVIGELLGDVFVVT